MSKKNLLKEELKRHRQLLEYTFYMPEDENDENDNLLFDNSVNLYEQDPIPGADTPVDTDAEVDPFATPEEGGAEVDPFATPEEGAAEVDPFDTPEEGAATEIPAEVDPFAAEGEGIPIDDEFPAEESDGEETVEVEVTDIVDKAEETRTEIEGLTSKMEELMGNFSELSNKVTGMDQVIEKIDGLEKEIERRNPTPVEKLEMRSMDSFPYSVKLTDYWDDKEGYDTGQGTDEEEYVITKNEVDDYTSSDIRQSFDYDMTEEDI